MGKKLNTAQTDLLREIVTRHDPSTSPLLDLLRERPLSQDEREHLRGLVADELVERGLEADDEPNAYGLQLEGLIDGLGKL